MDSYAVDIVERTFKNLDKLCLMEDRRRKGPTFMVYDMHSASKLTQNYQHYY